MGAKGQKWKAPGVSLSSSFLSALLLKQNILLQRQQWMYFWMLGGGAGRAGVPGSVGQGNRVTEYGQGSRPLRSSTGRDRQRQGRESCTVDGKEKAWQTAGA